MSKNLKIVITIIVIVLIILAFFLLFYIYPKFKYSLSYVETLINSKKDISNICILKEDKEKNGVISYSTTYIKDNFIYSNLKDGSGALVLEGFYNPNTGKRVNILINEKKILYSTESIDNISEPTENSNFIVTSQNATYKYVGKEKINNKECIIVCLTSETSNQISEDYYYIDLTSKYIVKHEQYEGTKLNNLEKTSETNYTYLYNVTSENDIKKFDINDYPDYEYKE